MSPDWEVAHLCLKGAYGRLETARDALPPDSVAAASLGGILQEVAEVLAHVRNVVERPAS